MPANSFKLSAIFLAAGYFTIGTVLGSFGPFLVLWSVIFDENPLEIAAPLIAFAAGYLLASLRPASRIMARFPILGCFISIAGWLALSASRNGGLLLIGCGTAVLARALLNRAAFPRTGEFLTLGALAGIGCVGAAYLLDTPPAAALLLAAFPFALSLLSRPLRQNVSIAEHRFEHRALASAILVTLVFFQSGCEFGLAFWIPAFFVRMTGANPLRGMALEFFFLASIVAVRGVSEKLFQGYAKRRILAGLIVGMLGYLLLSASSSVASDFAALGLIACGLAPIYGLTRDILDDRFRFDPELYSRLFLAGIVGFVAISWMLAYLDAWLGLRVLPLLLLLCSSLSGICQLLLLFEKHLMGSTINEPSHP